MKGAGVDWIGEKLLILNEQAYYILDEILIAGELQESSKRVVGRLIDAQVNGSSH